jgi:hypothetical protein
MEKIRQAFDNAFATLHESELTRAQKITLLFDILDTRVRDDEILNDVIDNFDSSYGYGYSGSGC